MKFTISELEAMPAQQVIEKLSGQIPNWPEITKRHFRPSSLKAIAIEEYAKQAKAEPLKTEPKPETDANQTTSNDQHKSPARSGDK